MRVLLLVLIILCHAGLVSASQEVPQQRIFGMANEANPSAGRYSSDNPNNPRPVRDDMVITYTHAPRGTIMSVPEWYLFRDGEKKIRQSALETLDNIAQKLSAEQHKCVIECHAGDWELSMARAASIYNYLSGKAGGGKLFTVAFGELMPERELALPDNRVDFVILDYQAKK
jgi:flagellar motor protein MotB